MELHANRIEKGFEALSVYNYFKAREVFYHAARKSVDAYACFGLATIYMRKDNPFHHLDSAVKYANTGFAAYRLRAVPLALSGFYVDSISIRKLADTISYLCYKVVRELNTVAACDHFLKLNYLGRKKYVYEVVYLRDELEYNNIMQLYRSDSTKEFIRTHPQSTFVKEALVLLDRQIYDENTRAGNAASYVTFLKKNPASAMTNTAYEKLFNIYKNNKDTKGLSEFVAHYPKAPQNLDAWKLLFSLTVKNYSFSELKKFIDDYPKFPLKNSILKDLELNKLVLYPVEVGDVMGYADTAGKITIAPSYDEVSSFSEGLAVVSRNDSVFYINKENNNPFGKVFNSATGFKNGIAAVKQGNKWFFINRQGQMISKSFDEINEPGDQAYVVKQGDRYGAMDQYAQVLIEPQFEKLGDFRNNYAYYIENGKYGFVSKTGSVHKPEFDWISQFDAEGLAVVKTGDSYGVINSSGKKILPIEYSLVLKTEDENFLIVKNGLYGFLSSEGCLITQVAFDFNKDKPVEYYTRNGLYRLLKKNEQALADANGRVLIPPGTFDEFGFRGIL